MSFILEKKTSEDGIWVDFEDDISGEILKLKVLPSNSIDYLKAKHSIERQNRSKNITDDKQYIINLKIIAKALVIDWEGVKDVEGKDLPYSEKDMVDLLTKCEYFVAPIMDTASNLENFVLRDVKETVKKSGKQ